MLRLWCRIWLNSSSVCRSYSQIIYTGHTGTFVCIICDSVSAGSKAEDSEMEMSHLSMIGRHYWLPGVPVPESPPLWYPYLPAYGSQAAAATAAAALAGGYKLVPDSATGHCYIIPGQSHASLLLTACICC